MRCWYSPYRLVFKVPSRTSREILTYKDVYYIRLLDENTGKAGIGECAVFPGLSYDYRPGYADTLIQACKTLTKGILPQLDNWPSIKFGIEGAMADLAAAPSLWHSGKTVITINGLIWMGSAEEMIRRVEQKLKLGFRCLKLKIGGINFNKELAILNDIRSAYPEQSLEIRLDANGAFSKEDALVKLEKLSRFGIHSIEQPLRQGQWEAMAELCRVSPIKIALDEELINVIQEPDKRKLLEIILPQYIILKPSLCGGLSGADSWIDLAEEYNIGWWATSALESNVGLDTIANWVSAKHPAIPQGLGTGELYVNNIQSPLFLQNDKLQYNSNAYWNWPKLDWIKI